MCEVFLVSRTGYYDWLNRSPSSRSARHQSLVERIKQLHKACFEIYGSPRIHRELVAEGEAIGVNTVAMLMKRNNIRSKVHKRFVVTTNSRHSLAIAPNLLKRDFETTKPNEKWVSDVTFIPTRQGWLYLATVMDLFSRTIVGWSMGTSNSTALVSNALKAALEQRGDVSGVILHSDRGSNYASIEYQKMLIRYNIIPSMSRKGDCWDNAVMESFYHSLKTEWMNFEDYLTRDEARSSLFAYIEMFYNRRRRHSSLNYMTPVSYEEEMSPT
jgi:putative transposase